MTDILIYFCIILVAAILTRKNFFPKFMLEKISILQTLALYILLGAMGLKIGADKNLMANLHILGIKSFVVAVLSIIFSIALVNLFYRGDRK